MHFKYLLLFLSVCQLTAYDAAYVSAIYDNVIKGYDLIPKQTSDKPLISQNIGEIVGEIFKPYESDFKILAWADSFKIITMEFTLEVSSIPKESVTDHKTLAELEIVRGSSNDAANIIRKLTAVNADTSSLTVIGQKRCAEMLCMPTTTMQDLFTRRDCIKAFYENTALLDEVAALLKKMKDAEPYVIDFCGKEGISDAEKVAYPSIILRVLSLDDIPAIVTFSNRLWTISQTPFFIPTLITATSFAAVVSQEMSQPLRPRTPVDVVVNTAITSLILNCSAGLPANMMMTLMSPITVGVAKAIANAIKRMQERTIGYATYMRSAKRLLELMVQNPELTRLMPTVKQQLRKLKGEDRSSSDTFVTINDLLMEESAFDEGEPSFFSSPGNILVAYKYLSDKNVRKEYASVINTIADIDTYAVLAQQMRSHAQNANTPFCFVEFIEGSDKPVLDIQNFWHPFISEKHAVPNSITLNQNRARNMLITGPNTGGKSTNMKAMALSVLLAQTFGIAPASSMKMTPFSAIITYLNVIDDTSAGLSLFKAEVKRVQELMDAVKNLPAGRFAFVMLDEIFTGTSPDKAEELSYGFMKKLSEFEHVIFICATHFKKLTELETVTKGVTKNYQVEVITDENDMVTQYTYKIVPGISKISSAQQVVEETGLVF